MTWEEILNGGSASAGPSGSPAPRPSRARVFWGTLGGILALLVVGLVVLAVLAVHVFVFLLSVLQGFVILLSIFFEAIARLGV